MNRRQYAIAVVFSASLLFAASVSLSGQQGSSYDPWLDYNGDGTIAIEDLAAVGKAYGTSGTPLNMPMAMEYDSGWIDVSDKQGQHFDITPGFNLETSTWTPTVRGKVGADTLVHQKYWYGYEMPGWNQTYGGTENDEGRSVVPTGDGGYAMTGFRPCSGLSSQAYLVKTSVDGTMEWNKTYGGTSYDWGYSVVETSDGGYAIAGYTNSYGAGTPAYSNVYFVKTLADGTMNWYQKYGGDLEDVGTSVIEASGGGYAIAGYTYDGGYQVYLVKTLADGTLEWDHKYGGTGEDKGCSVVETSDGGYAIAGYTTSYGVGTPTYGNVYLVKTFADGTMDWNKTYGGYSDDYGFSVVEASDGGYVIAGYTYSYGGGWQVYLVKTDASGEMTWYKTYGGAGHDYGLSVVQTDDGGYAIAGYTESFGSGKQVYLVKTDSLGNMLWSRTHGGTGEDYGCSVVETSDGGYAIAGYTNSFGSGEQVYLVKTDALGLMDLEWGVTITNITADTVTFYRGKMDPYYNYIRVRIWVVKETP